MAKEALTMVSYVDAVDVSSSRAVAGNLEAFFE